MPKPAKDLRIHGVSFEQAAKRILSAPPMKKAKTKKVVKNPRLN